MGIDLYICIRFVSSYLLHSSLIALYNLIHSSTLNISALLKDEIRASVKYATATEVETAKPPDRELCSCFLLAENPALTIRKNNLVSKSFGGYLMSDIFKIALSTFGTGKKLSFLILAIISGFPYN